MITALRTRLGTWFARILFGVLVISFAAFGVGDVIRWFGMETWVAKVGPRTIEIPELQQAYQGQMAQLMRVLGGRIDPTMDMKRGIAARALENLINEATLDQELRRLHVLAPESAVGQDIMAMREFRGPDGQFSKPMLLAALRNANMSEYRFLELMRNSLAQRQLLGSLRNGIGAPDVLVKQVFAFQHEKRSAEMIELPFAAITPPEADEAVLRRWYDNHPDRYTNPEYRRIKVVILAPQTLASQIEITEEELRAAYESRRDVYITPEKRSAEIIMIQDEAKAGELAAKWRAGAADGAIWEAMQKAAADAGGSAVALADARQQEFPDPALGAAVFAAAQGAVTDPVKNALGWQVVRVTAIAAGAVRSFEDARQELRDRLLEEKAAEVIHSRAAKIEDVLAGGTGLDDLPGDLGLAALTGTIDAQGKTMAREPAPMPGPAELRTAVVTAAFEARPGDPPRLNEVRPGQGSGTSSYFALALEAVTPPGLRPFEEIKETVAEDFAQAARRRTQEEAAAKILAAVQGGQSMEDAATVAGLPLVRTALTGRSEPAEGMPRELMTPLFGLKKGEATMVETPEAFIVATAAEITVPDPVADAAAFQQTRTALADSLGNDVDISFLTGVRTRAKPLVNQKILDNFVQP